MNTYIEIKDNYTIIVQEDKGVKAEKQLPIGAGSVATHYFKHNPPLFSELEDAITVIEDELMIYARTMQHDTALFTSDSDVRQIMSYVLPVNPDKTTLSATELEVIFGRLGAIISGRPASSDVLPEDRIFIARVLILREILAHLKFKEITFV